MKIMIVVGARPNFMKAAPIIAAINDHNARATTGSADGPLAIQYALVHTGQHYDEFMSDRFFADLNLPKPDVHLGVGSGSHAVQTAEIMKRFEEVVTREKPDVLVVVGDVNSTLACALVAAKILFDSVRTRPLIAHVEAGLRSFDRTMPEEINRILTDHVSDILFVTEQSGLENLRSEGIPKDKIHFVGNTMIDSLLTFKDKAEASTILDKLGLRRMASKNGSAESVGRYALLTLHRPSNVDNREALLNILEGLEELASHCPIVFPAHPRTRKRIEEFGLEGHFQTKGVTPKRTGETPESIGQGIVLINPLGYLDFLCLMKHASLVLTDSGGIQEETTCLGTSCVTLRKKTERPVTVGEGTNAIAGISGAGIRKVIKLQLEANPRRRNHLPKKWDGQASIRIVRTILRVFHKDKEN